MGILSTLKDKSKFVGGLVRWYKSIWFPVVYAALGVLSASFGFFAYLPVFYSYVLIVLGLVLFCDDVQPLLVPVIVTSFAIGGDGLLNFGDATSDVTTMFEPVPFAQLIACLAVILCSVVVKLVYSGGFKAAFTKKGVFNFGILALGIAFIFNGAFSPLWQPINILYGLMEGVGLIFAFFVSFAIVSKNEDNFIPYACKIAAVTAVMISLEVGILLIKLAAGGNLFVFNDAGDIVDLNKNNFVLGWGVANPVAAVLVFLVPFMLYIAYAFKRGPLIFIPVALVYVTVIILKARTALIVGLAVLVAGLIICCTGGRNKVTNRYVVAIMVGLLCVVLGFMWQRAASVGWDNLLSNILNFIRFDEGDNGRFTRWLNGLQDFCLSPVFGVGFADGGVTEAEHAANDFIYYTMYHNLPVEIIGASGLVGAFGFIVHIKDVLKMILYRPTRERLVLSLIPLAVIAGSFLDNFFYYFNVQLIYGLSLVLIELKREEMRKAELALRARPATHERKPRVCFTFIEAGMGHVIPEKAICDVFEEKYGDVVEVVRSKIYEDTGDADLAAVEDGFVRNVKMHNKSAIYGKFCVFMNVVSGNYLSRKYVLGAINHGSRAAKKAVKLLESINADLIFSTHWATPYYIDKMKGRRPYTILLCPDAYSNGMFDIDVNDFLMTNRVGAKKTEHKRMYAGGNVSVVPYPIRQDAYEYEGKKAEVRESLGIAQDSFVVILADGGYGAAKLVDTVKYLVRSDVKMTVIAICGTNVEGEKTLRGLEKSDNVDLRVYGYTTEILKLIAASDLFIGKSGANSMAEPAFYGVPAIITKCITPIETGIMKYYVKHVRSALYLPDSRKAAKKACEFASCPELLRPFAENAAKLHDSYGAVGTADLLFERVKSMFPSLENGSSANAENKDGTDA